MSESERNERRRVVAMVGNPTSDKGRGAKVDAQVLGLLEEAGRAHTSTSSTSPARVSTIP